MPLDFTYARNSGQAVITVFAPGKDPMILDSDHLHFQEVFAALQDPHHKGLSDAQLIDLCDVEKGVAMRFERLSERVTVRDRRVFFDGDPMDTALTKQLLATMHDGGSLSALIAFYEKVMTNPLERARNELYGWVRAHGVTIVAEGPGTGDLVLFKGCSHGDGDGAPLSTHTGRAIVNGEVIEGFIPYPTGAIVEMPRSEVRNTPSQPCNDGLHCGTYAFARGFSSVLLEVRVNPRDVVNVPDAANKVRVCRLKVVGPANQAETYQRSTISTPAPVAEPVGPEKPHVPTAAEWDDMQARAKIRRQNFQKYASTTGGWTFSSNENADPKDPLNWRVSPVEERVPEAPHEPAEAVATDEPETRTVHNFGRLGGTLVEAVPTDISVEVPPPPSIQREPIEREARNQGIDWPPSWIIVGDQLVASFGPCQVIGDDEDRGIFAGDKGKLYAEIVGAPEFHNERVAFFFVPADCPEAQAEVVPLDDIEPVPDDSPAYPDMEDPIGGRSDLDVQADETEAAAPVQRFDEDRTPTEAEFITMMDRAKRRRQNFQKYAAQIGGWRFSNDPGADPKSPQSWKIPGGTGA